MTMTARTNDWWESELEVQRTESMLVRAGVLRKDDAGPGMYFRGKPYKWDRERTFCLALEVAMCKAGIDPVEGWEMTFREIAEHLTSIPEKREPYAPGVCPMAIKCLPGRPTCVACKARVGGT